MKNAGRRKNLGSAKRFARQNFWKKNKGSNTNGSKVMARKPWEKISKIKCYLILQFYYSQGVI